jgi:putative flippase GtrA
MTRKAFQMILSLINCFTKVLGIFITKRLIMFCTIGGICFGINFIIFYISYHYFFVNCSNQHIVAWLFSQLFSIPTGFYLKKKLFFSKSSLRLKTQFFRFFLINITNISISLLLLNFLIVACSLSPMIALIITMTISVSISYLAQLNFAFKKD